MKSYCLKCKKDTENINWRTLNTSNGKRTILSKCAICGRKKPRYIKDQEAKGLLSSLGVRITLSKVPVLGDILFWMQNHLKCMLNCIKMNEIVNKFLLAGDKFMPEMHLKQPRFTYSACQRFTKNKERIKKFKETRDTSYIYKNKLNKTCFQHDMAYGDSNDLARRTTSDKIVRDKVHNIGKNPR